VPAEIDVKQLVADSDTGGRKPGPLVARLMLVVCAGLEPVPAVDRLAAAVRAGLRRLQRHAVARHPPGLRVFLAYMAYPAFKRSPRDHVPLSDWVFALVGAFCASYLFFFYRELSTRPGQPTQQDLSSPSSASCCCWRPRGARWGCRWSSWPSCS
jgi:TRAP-type uncharacterized transport system fused permease subunit